MTSIEQRIINIVATCTSHPVWQRCAEPGYPYVAADGCFRTTADFTGSTTQSITTPSRHGRERLDAVRTRRAFYRDERRGLSSIAAALAHQGLQAVRTAEGLQIGELSVSCVEELAQDGSPTGRALWRVADTALAAVTDGTCPQDAVNLITRAAGLEPTLSH